MGLWMLASLHGTSGLKWPVVLHEDGSLGEAQLDLYATLFPGLRIFRRSEADEMMRERLISHPRCADYRLRMPHGLKCFDIPHLSAAPRFLMLDPDVLFFAKPHKILDWAADSMDESCWFNQDFQEASPISPSQAAQDLGVSLWPKVNTGVCMVVRESLTNLDDMEQWLAHPTLHDARIQWRVEQTLLALAASKAGNGGLLPPIYEVSPNKNRRRDCIARHYVGCVRDRFYSEGLCGVHKMIKSIMSS
jgi:hypothetical protein